MPRPDEGLDQSVPLPHYVLYPILGFFLGLGSPVGAFLLRFWRADPLLKGLWIRSELSYNADFYAYMAVGTITAFVAFGYVLGRLSERQRVRNRLLRARVEELHLKSVTDGLTGAFSHAYLRETLAIEIERARRHRRPLSVLILDLDDFKKLNDTHGHLFGDRVLKEVTETVSMSIRHEDVLGRYGGEEFLVIMPGADAEVARRVAERIRRAVERAGVLDVRRRDSSEPVRTTLSIGAATYAGEAPLDAAAFIDRADRGLYEAKNGGKNRVVQAA